MCFNKLVRIGLIISLGISNSVWAGTPLNQSSTSGMSPAGCEPASPFIFPGQFGLDLPFCAQWDPDYAFKGGRCCVPGGKLKKKRKGPRCDPKRSKQSFCDEMTAEQKNYIKAVENGQVKDVLALLSKDIHNRINQSYCTPNDGFLVGARPVMPSDRNFLYVRRPDRCTHFGTDGMVAMLEWTGRKFKDQFPESEISNPKLLIGDISAPRGGCLAGRGGYRGHSSHMAGRDVDIGFVTLKRKHARPGLFHKNFEPEPNWWLLKQLFANPFVCVQVVFLDSRHIAKLRKAAQGDPDWEKVRGFVRHVRNHRDHFHVRIGDHPGAPGCGEDLNDEDLSEFVDDAIDPVDGGEGPDSSEPSEPADASDAINE